MIIAACAHERNQFCREYLSQYDSIHRSWVETLARHRHRMVVCVYSIVNKQASSPHNNNTIETNSVVSFAQRDVIPFIRIVECPF